VVADEWDVPFDELLVDFEGEPPFDCDGELPFDFEGEPPLAPAPCCFDGAVVEVVALGGVCSVVTVTEVEALAALATWAKLLTKKPVTIPAPMKIICVSWRTRSNRCRRAWGAENTSFIRHLLQALG
jgi:hypothetical protein